VAKNRARGNRQSRRVGWKIDVRLTRTLGIALQRKGTVGVSMPEFRQDHSPARDLDLNSVLSRVTGPALALAMFLRTASVVSSTRVLGRWNLRVAVDTRRQRPYRLRRVSSAANTSSDLIALIAPVKDFEDSQSNLVTTRSAEPHLFKTARRPYLSVRPLFVGRAIRRRLEAYWGLLSTFLSSHRDVTSVASICPSRRVS
jgi:hypothetical protein